MYINNWKQYEPGRNLNQAVEFWNMNQAVEFWEGIETCVLFEIMAYVYIFSYAVRNMNLESFKYENIFKQKKNHLFVN